MNGAGKLRIALVAGALILVTGVYLLPKTPQPKSTDQTKESSTEDAGTFSLEKLIADSKIKLGWNNDNQVNNWEELLKTKDANPDLYDSIALAWEAAMMPGISAWYFNQKAEKTQVEKDWLNASYRYFDAYKAAKDSAEMRYFVDKAITSYSKVLDLNPNNLNAKTDLGLLYTEGTSEPMKGIMLLREVVTENPLHENANLNLGFLSMKSGQYDKAIDRFNKVLEINPARIDMYIYLGEAYVRTGANDKAIESFEIFKNLSNDQEMIEEVDEYIATIKK